MAMTRSGAPAVAFTPEDVGPLVVEPVVAAAAALNPSCSTLLRTQNAKLHLPVVAEDPSAAWVAEGGEITPDDATLTEVVVTPAKVAGLTVISSELADDSSPSAAQIVGDALTRDIARKVDAAFFGSVASPAPAGLGSLAATAVDAGASITDLDPFEEAISKAQALGADLTAFACSPAMGLVLAELKQFAAVGSNVPLLQSDPTQPTRRQIGGVPLVVSPDIGDDTVVWGIPASRVFTVLRLPATLVVDRSWKFNYDQVAVRAILRVGFGFPQPAAIMKIAVTG